MISGWMQPAVPSAGASSARQSHWTQADRLEEYLVGDDASPACRRGLSTLSWPQTVDSGIHTLNVLFLRYLPFSAELNSVGWSV